jgi:hypothetical protein
MRRTFLSFIRVDPLNPRLQIPDRSRTFRKWDGEIPATGQRGLWPIDLSSRKPFSFCVKRNDPMSGITHAKGFQESLSMSFVSAIFNRNEMQFRRIFQPNRF